MFSIPINFSPVEPILLEFLSASGTQVFPLESIPSSLSPAPITVEGRTNALLGANADTLTMEVARMIAEVASFILMLEFSDLKVVDTVVMMFP